MEGCVSCVAAHVSMSWECSYVTAAQHMPTSHEDCCTQAAIRHVTPAFPRNVLSYKLDACGRASLCVRKKAACPVPATLLESLTFSRLVVSSSLTQTISFPSSLQVAVDVGSAFGHATAKLQASRQLSRLQHGSENSSNSHSCAGSHGHITMPWDVQDGSGQQMQVHEGVNMDPGQGIVKKTKRNAGGGNKRTHMPALQQPAWES
eukprot:scaffold286188_cov16-Tisochrysis_lutea.AAC.1